MNQNTVYVNVCQSAPEPCGSGALRKEKRRGLARLSIYKDNSDDQSLSSFTPLLYYSLLKITMNKVRVDMYEMIISVAIAD